MPFIKYSNVKILSIFYIKCQIGYPYLIKMNHFFKSFPFLLHIFSNGMIKCNLMGFFFWGSIFLELWHHLKFNYCNKIFLKNVNFVLFFLFSRHSRKSQRLQQTTTQRTTVAMWRNNNVSNKFVSCTTISQKLF